MKYGEVKLLIESSHVLKLTAHTLNVATALKLFNLKKSLEKSYKELSEKEKGLLEEVGIDIQKDLGEKGEYIAPLDAKGNKDYSKFERFLKLRNELYNSDIDLKLGKLNFEEWHLLSIENSAVTIPDVDTKVDICSGIVERFLEDVFFDTSLPG